MASYRISGVWKDSNDKITHYAFHLIEKNSISRMQKKTKTEAVALLEINGNSATTWVWNYRFSNWNIGEDVHVVNASNGKYLRSDPDDVATNNLAHLIDYDWIVR